MKKNLYACMAILFASSLMFSCSDDNKDPEPPVGPEDVNATYGSGDNALALNYSGAALAGKTVSFNTSDKETATLVLTNVIPGETSTTLSEVELKGTETQYTFSGTDEKEGREVKYTGSVEKGKLTLSLEVTMPENGLVGAWDLAKLIKDDGVGANLSQPLYINWTGDAIIDLQSLMGFPFSMPVEQLAVFMSNELSGKLEDVLKSMTFHADGNITASYRKAGETNWQTSSLNLAQYYIKNNTMYAVLNLDMILAEMSTRADVGGSSNILTMLATGIPMTYKVNADGTATVGVTKELVQAVLSDQTIWGLLTALLGNNEYAGIIAQLPEAFAATDTFEAGLNLVK